MKGGARESQAQRAEEPQLPSIEPAREWFTVGQAIGELSCVDELVIWKEIRDGKIPSEVRMHNDREQRMISRSAIESRLLTLPIPATDGSGLHTDA